MLIDTLDRGILQRWGRDQTLLWEEVPARLAHQQEQSVETFWILVCKTVNWEAFSLS